ncbi:MAG: glycosyltransferase family 4 protein [Planctomycetota bacterium]|jgi:glycosyltransferase involved in cell wall biosynthesis
MVNSISKRTVRAKVFEIRSPEKDNRALLDLADRIGADVIWLGYGNISYPLLKYIKANSDYRVVLDTDSVWSQFVRRGLPYGGKEEERRKTEEEARAKEEEEAWGTRMADVTTAVCEADADHYRALVEDPGRVKLFRNVLDPDDYGEVPPPPEGLKKPYMYMAGSFVREGSAMTRSARWVIEEVLPRVRKQLPEVHLYLVGKGSERCFPGMADRGITATGMVDSVLPYLCHADVALAVLLFEAAGTKFKVLEASICGIPIVANGVGAEGVPETYQKYLVTEDEPEAFAAAVVEMIRHPSAGKEMAAHMKDMVHTRFSIDALVREGEAILAQIQAGP